MTALCLLIVIALGIFDVAFLWTCGGGARVIAVVLAGMVLAALWAFGAIVTAAVQLGINASAMWEFDR